MVTLSRNDTTMLASFESATLQTHPLLPNCSPEKSFTKKQYMMGQVKNCLSFYLVIGDNMKDYSSIARKDKSFFISVVADVVVVVVVEKC